MTRDQIIAAQQAIVDAARQAGRDMTPEEVAQFDCYQRMLDAPAPAPAPADGQRAMGTPVPAPAPAATPAPDDGQRAVMQERERVASIMALCRDFDVDPTPHITAGHSMDEVRSAILDGLRQTSAPVSVRVVRDEGDNFRAAASDALLMRAGIPVERPADGARELRAMSLRDLGVECLSKSGRSANELLRKSSDELYGELCREFYNPSSAFPAIMDETIRKGIVHLYNQEPTTFEAVTERGTLRDFKSTPDHEYVIGGVGDFLKVPENGEIKPDLPRTEILPSRKLDTYGKQFSMTRQAFINDDIGFLTEVPGLYAASAKKTIDKQVWSLLYNNDTIFDGVKFFHNNHNNLIGTGSAPSQASIQAAILKLQRQKDHFGEPIYITPTKIAVGVGYEFDLAVIFRSTQVVGSSNNDVNPLYNYPLQVVQTPVLNGLAGTGACPWFLFGSGARGIQVDYFNGQETPTIRRMESPGTLGFVWDIWLDWGISVRDYRSIVRNNGVPIAAA